MEILYVCSWDKCREKTWSGTTYSLYKTLEAKIPVQNIDVTLNRKDKMFIKLQRFTDIKFKNEKVKIIHEFSSLKTKIYQKKVNRLIKNDKKSVVLQIGDYGLCDNKTYVYQDLSLDSLFYFKEKYNGLFQYSGFQNYLEDDMSRRRENQFKFYNNIHGIFTMGKWLANNLVEYSKIPKEKVHWVGGGINLNIKKVKPFPKSKNKILFVGRDFFRKGGDLVYKAFKVLKRYLPNVELYVAGPKEWPLKDKDDNLRFLGEINSDELSDYFNLCDIFCMPSRFEAYGLVFIEALVYGLPCIGRNNFEMKEFIKEGYNGYLIENDDIEQLAIKMYQLLNNDDIKSNVVTNRNKYIKEYSWDTVADRIINIINKA
ncbi:glycosyltransferase family 4 protein [Clostridium saccharobutylicum]|uniref:Lipopolysaccharide N-acetylglucosaminyltransferase n=4 Tax=Clostridium saccharobutylicum TaxID=169679 RepID=U5MWI0_CLOSA|nr:glycosyltransferase family 4 protein [Clostridium saccharobutylicum]AGX43822.1 lipopolysaccharide N-acetylglucosaminyltransferase [Clostridium saccharobutylicum DSM 13864]AQR91122.1 GDP-mannose-dependent alpha-(1-2)-phosphatidylinositol mannosyltransferase [Clostridium saccharobutylicum]AQS01026.1 GDP-mannose-dependent alpha-(1-2)-phosphatidylinositol mannosyltransferase [Clostridium saccharobutylicum]AQS15009.1 GDP-mannose-dependent alpha-(1-2)-phosphatidylinositol mannosyltransferase [Clos